MPISTLISLIPETDVTLRPTMGHHAHAAFLCKFYAKVPPDLSRDTPCTVGTETLYGLAPHREGEDAQ